jgi:hypothetical protein
MVALGVTCRVTSQQDLDDDGPRILTSTYCYQAPTVEGVPATGAGKDVWSTRATRSGAIGRRGTSSSACDTKAAADCRAGLLTGIDGAPAAGLCGGSVPTSSRITAISVVMGYVERIELPLSQKLGITP